jgi:hypothetical protein
VDAEQEQGKKGKANRGGSTEELKSESAEQSAPSVEAPNEINSNNDCVGNMQRIVVGPPEAPRVYVPSVRTLYQSQRLRQLRPATVAYLTRIENMQRRVQPQGAQEQNSFRTLWTPSILAV